MKIPLKESIAYQDDAIVSKELLKQPNGRIVTFAFGAAFSGLVDQMLPEFDVDLDVDIDVDGPDMAVETPALSTLLSWLHVGRVPTLILFASFLFGFAVSGLAVQQLSLAAFHSPLSAWIAVVPAFFGSLPFVHVSGRLFRAYLPSEESDSVERGSLVGKTATLTLGEARSGQPAQAKLRDAKGQMHYVMVEPTPDHEVLGEGTEVVLVRLSGATYAAVPSGMQRLLD